MQDEHFAVDTIDWKMVKNGFTTEYSPMLLIIGYIDAIQVEGLLGFVATQVALVMAP